MKKINKSDNYSFSDIFEPILQKNTLKNRLLCPISMIYCIYRRYLPGSIAIPEWESSRGISLIWFGIVIGRLKGGDAWRVEPERQYKHEVKIV